MPVADMRQAARMAGQLLLRHQGDMEKLQVEAKGVHDFVTFVDRASEDAIVSFLEKRWPGVPFLAEESDARKTDAPERWIVDPLDGTTNYIHGYPCYGVSIAFQSGGRIAAGVIYDPVRDEMYCAEDQKGATLNDRPISVSQVTDLGQSLLVTGFPFRSLGHLDEYLAGFRLLLQQASGVRRDGSAALDLCYVAAGRYDGFWEMGLSPWDVAAGSLIVQCAGGRVSDYANGSNWLEGEEIVAATTGIHGAIINALREATGR